jgi:hypothetical protein
MPFAQKFSLSGFTVSCKHSTMGESAISFSWQETPRMALFFEKSSIFFSMDESVSVLTDWPMAKLAIMLRPRRQKRPQDSPHVANSSSFVRSECDNSSSLRMAP